MGLRVLKQAGRIRRYTRGRGLLVMDTHSLTEEQARWLTRILEVRPRKALLDHFVVPADVHDALVEMGLIRWHHGLVEITLDGIRAVAQRPLPQD